MIGRWGMGLVLLAACAVNVEADPPAAPATPTCSHAWWHWHPWCSWCPPIGGCPDDYVHKPCPPILPVARCGGVDDYCRKPYPKLIPVSYCGGLDDYCRKPMPCLLCPPHSPYLHCGPAGGSCSDGKR